MNQCLNEIKESESKEKESEFIFTKLNTVEIKQSYCLFEKNHSSNQFDIELNTITMGTDCNLFYLVQMIEKCSHFHVKNFICSVSIWTILIIIV